MDAILHVKGLLHFTGRAQTEKVQEKKEMHDIITELNDLKRRIEEVDMRFDLQVDEDLIEACIYEKNSLLARYRHLLKYARERGLTCHPCENMPRFEGEYLPWG